MEGTATRHFGTITYYNSEKKLAYVNENGTDYVIGSPIVQNLADPDTLLRKDNTIFFTSEKRKVPGKADYAQYITRVVERCNPRDERTEGEKRLMEIFRASKWLSGWTILEQPHINGLKLDFLLLHPRKGAVIIEVKDWDLTDDTRYREGAVLGNDGNYHPCDPAYQLNKYAECLSGLFFLEPEGFREHILNVLNSARSGEDEELDLWSYPFFGKVVFFSREGVTLEQARAFCPNSQCIWTRKEAEYLLDPDHKFSDCEEYPWPLRLFAYGKIESESRYHANAPRTEDGKNIFAEYIRQLTCWLDGTDYERSREKPYQLTPAQSALARHAPGACRLCEGVAGSGKTLILAQKAADAVRVGRRVLVLTYNITLINYLRDLCRQQYTGDSRTFNQWLTVDYFHNILRGALHRPVGRVESELEYTTKAIDLLRCDSDAPVYDDVLVDEGNDYRGFEIEFLKEEIYNGKGEFLVMYDPAQRIYSKKNSQGNWGDDPAALKLDKLSLTSTYCIPRAVADRLERVRKHCNIPGIPMEIEGLAEDQSRGCVRWIDHDRARREEIVLDELSYWLKDRGVHPEDLSLVTISYPCAEKLKNILERAGIPVQFCEKSRHSKYKFWAGKNNVKIATYHNFKGWHTPYVILVLDPELDQGESEEFDSVFNAVYVALSRVKPTKDTHAFCFRCLNFVEEDHDGMLGELLNAD